MGELSIILYQIHNKKFHYTFISVINNIAIKQKVIHAKTGFFSLFYGDQTRGLPSMY
jgi:hypothetical protein